MSALLNGLAILDMFTTPGQVVTVAEVSRVLEVHKSTASRIAATLVESGYLRTSSRGVGFELGGKLTRLGQLVGSSVNLPEIAGPVLRRLADELGETCHLGVLDGDEAVTVAFADGTHAMRMHAFVGKRSPAYCTAMGKSLMAYFDDATLDELYPEENLEKVTPRSVGNKTELRGALEEVRAQGYAIDDEELEIGLRCISAPVFDYSGAAIASVTLAASASRVSLTTASLYARRVIDAAAEISKALGASAAVESAPPTVRTPEMA